MLCSELRLMSYPCCVLLGAYGVINILHKAMQNSLASADAIGEEPIGCSYML